MVTMHQPIEVNHDAYPEAAPIFIGSVDSAYLMVKSEGQVIFQGRLIGVDRAIRRALIRQLHFLDSLELCQVALHLGNPEPGYALAEDAEDDLYFEFRLPTSPGELSGDPWDRMIMCSPGAYVGAIPRMLSDEEVFARLRLWAEAGES